MNVFKDVNSYQELKKPCFVACDFCEREFKNRYESIIHNASHIIIPLWVQTFYKCNTCNSYTTSLEELETHTSRHPVTQEIRIKNGYRTKNVTSYKNKTKEIRDILQECNLELNGKDESDVIKQIDVEPIRSRLKFEEDVISQFPKGLINDLVTDCQVNIQIFDPPWIFPSIRDQEYKQKKDEVYAPETYMSVDYDSLMKPGIFNCRYCPKSYPNRFSLVKHEMYHIKISRGTPILCIHCDKYIAGNVENLNLHKAKYHPDNIKSKKFTTFICKRCGLRFRKYKRHVRNYHIYDCRDCRMEFDNAKQYADHVEHHADHKQHVDHSKRNVDQMEQRVDHSDRCNKSNVIMKIINVCDLCYSFLKRRINLRYYLIGETDNKLGVRYPCDNCGKKYFVLKTVKRIQKMNKCYKDHKNRLTNEDRLKNIQHRLKKLNLMNKFYSVV